MINIKIDSRKIEPGDTFVAIPGQNFDGHDFIPLAIGKGAIKVIAEKNENYGVETKVVANTKEYLKEYLVANYASDFNDLKIIGITGTNGKTTMCHFLYQMMKNAGKKVAYIGSLGLYIDDLVTESPNTTPNILDLYENLYTAKNAGCEFVILEVSSQALAEERIAGLFLEAAVLTSFAPAHLDFHKTKRKYLQAKLKIIDYLKKDGFLVINSDAKKASKFKYRNLIKVGKKKADVLINNLVNSNDGTIINFNYLARDYAATIPFKGDYNCMSYLLALTIASQTGGDINQIITASPTLINPPGRSQIFNYQGSRIVVDFAHNPEAIEKVINTYKEKYSKIITIIGCSGNRHRAIRANVGKLVTKLSDHVIFTNDNPRTEDPNQIFNDITSKLKTSNFEIIPNRAEALSKGFKLLTAETVLFILGKGNEKYQIIGTDNIEYSDLETVKNFISHP